MPAARDALVTVLREEADEEKRAAAAYLLAYAPTPEQVVAAGAVHPSQLVAMAGLTQPINREPALLVLEQLSGEKYDTAEKWKAWLARQGQ